MVAIIYEYDLTALARRYDFNHRSQLLNSIMFPEAENERMHLLVCLDTFKASWATRALVITAQVVMTPTLMCMYLLYPKSLHRFVGYLEETACTTYVNVIRHVETPGTQLHEGK
jgi:hypothetical protein